MIMLIAWHVHEALVSAPEFKSLGLKKKLGKPEECLKIPVVKTEQIPTKAMDIKQSTNDGQVQILSQMFAAAGIGDPLPPSEETTPDTEVVNKHIQPLENRVFLIHGNLSTFERLRACGKY